MFIPSHALVIEGISVEEWVFFHDVRRSHLSPLLTICRTVRALSSTLRRKR